MSFQNRESLPKVFTMKNDLIILWNKIKLKTHIICKDSNLQTLIIKIPIKYIRANSKRKPSSTFVENG